MTEPRRRRHRLIASSNALVGLLALLGIWTGLPARWLPVDVGATVWAVLLLTTGVALGLGLPRALRFFRIVAGASMLCGTALCAALGYTAGELSGLYGPVGMGGAAILGVALLLLFPYLVVLPGAQLYWLADAQDD